MGNQIANTESSLKIADPFGASMDALLVVPFPRSNSKNYGFAVSIAETAVSDTPSFPSVVNPCMLPPLV